MSLPISTSHCVAGSTIAVGLMNGKDSVDFSLLNKIWMSWVATLPAAGLTAALVYSLLFYVYFLGIGFAIY